MSVGEVVNDIYQVAQSTLYRSTPLNDNRVLVQHSMEGGD